MQRNAIESNQDGGWRCRRGRERGTGTAWEGEQQDAEREEEREKERSRWAGKFCSTLELADTDDASTSTMDEPHSEQLTWPAHVPAAFGEG